MRCANGYRQETRSMRRYVYRKQLDPQDVPTPSSITVHKRNASSARARLFEAVKSTSPKCKLAPAQLISAIPRSSKAWWRAKRRNDGIANSRSMRELIGSGLGSTCRSRQLKFCLSTIRWYCTSNVYFPAVNWTDPIYYEVPVCDCRFIMHRKRQDAAVVGIAVVGYRQCCRLSTAGRQYDSCGCGNCCG
jgi:hypothetical protein